MGEKSEEVRGGRGEVNHERRRIRRFDRESIGRELAGRDVTRVDDGIQDLRVL